MVLRRIPKYFLSTIVHDLKPKLASPGKASFLWRIQLKEKIEYLIWFHRAPKSSLGEINMVIYKIFCRSRWA